MDIRWPAEPRQARSGYLVGLIGAGISASFTPRLHEVEAAALGLDYEYRLLDLIDLGMRAEDVGALLAEARSHNFSAMNITHPCKQRVLDVVDELDPRAEDLGAVNLVIFEEEKLVGYNTDWIGYRDGLEAGLPGAPLDRVVQIGCGGAGAATAYALLSSGVRRLDLFDVDEARVKDIAERMRSHFPSQVIETVPHRDLEVMIARANGVVHATPMGMLHAPGVAFDVALLREGAWVSDVVYRPLETELIRLAAERGHPVLDGGRMAVGQAYASLQIITGREPNRERMEEHFRTLIRQEQSSGPSSRG